VVRAEHAKRHEVAASVMRTALLCPLSLVLLLWGLAALDQGERREAMEGEPVAVGGGRLHGRKPDDAQAFTERLRGRKAPCPAVRPLRSGPETTDWWEPMWLFLEETAASIHCYLRIKGSAFAASGGCR